MLKPITRQMLRKNTNEVLEPHRTHCITPSKAQ